jgi:very-short-patch-repair endonuclease/predicted transcriptional regulator of viral defense system
MRPESAQDEGASHAGQIAAEIRPGSAQRRDRSDRAIAAWARGQHGVLTLGQLETLGLSPRAVRHRTASGRLKRLHTGVYATGYPSNRSRWMAAVLACGTGALLSHRSAAALWGIADDRRRVDVAVLNRAGRSRPGIEVHRGGTLEPQDITIHDGIPCTTPARTLLDIAATVDRRTLERAVDHAETLRIFDLDALQDILQRNPRRRGRAALTAILAEYAPSPVTRSPAEERMLELIEIANLPRPRVNEWIALDDNTGYEADFLWPAARLIVEVDGRAHHARRGAFAHDRERDRRLALAGYETRRYAAAELTSRPELVIAEIRAFLTHQ